jgi:hypothetical protein
MRKICLVLLLLIVPLSARALRFPAAGAPSVVVVQSGGGHNVVVTWAASPDAAANPGITYNGYRAVSACPPPSGVSFTKIDSTAAGALTFTDTAVTVATTYCYEITAVLNGLESAPSPQAQAVIPLAPPQGPVTAVPH